MCLGAVHPGRSATSSAPVAFFPLILDLPLAGLPNTLARVSRLMPLFGQSSLVIRHWTVRRVHYRDPLAVSVRRQTLRDGVDATLFLPRISRIHFPVPLASLFLMEKGFRPCGMSDSRIGPRSTASRRIHRPREKYRASKDHLSGSECQPARGETRGRWDFDVWYVVNTGWSATDPRDWEISASENRMPRDRRHQGLERDDRGWALT